MEGAAQNPAGLIEAFLGSAHLFGTAVTHLLEQALVREVAAGSVTPAQMKMLKLVEQADGPTVGHFAVALEVSNAAASKAVDRLVRRGLLTRAEGKEDRRASEVALTPAGEHLLRRFECAKTLRLEQIFDHYSPVELRRTAEILEQMAASITEDVHGERKTAT